MEGSRKNAAWFEWGIDEEKDIHDVELWYLTNPSLGFHLTERDVEDEISNDVLDFQIQRLGLWVKYNQKSAITKKDWEELKAFSLPKLIGRLHVGIKYGSDGKNVALAIAVKTLSQKIFIEAIDIRSIRAGNDWIINFLKSADIEKVVIDGAGGQNILASEMKDYRLPQPVLPRVGTKEDCNEFIYRKNIR